MAEPTLFLDVDGVLSPCPNTSGAWRDWQRVDCGFYLHLSREMGKALAELPVEIVWLTTWEEMANEVIAPWFGWDQLRVVDRSQYHEEPWWKYNAIEHHCDQAGTPFIWVDDDLGDFVEGYKEIGLVGGGVDCLLLSPSSAIGITQSHLRAMAKWARDHS